MRKGQTIEATRRIESLVRGGYITVAERGDPGRIVRTVRAHHRTVTVSFDRYRGTVTVGHAEIRRAD